MEAPPPPTAAVAPPRRVGQLSGPWRIAMVATWSMVFFSYMGVWKASKEIGIGTWWLGPRSTPQPTIVSLIPFVVAATVAATAGYNVRRLPWIGVGGSVVMLLIAVPDLSRSPGLAIVEFAIASAALVVSLASFTGVYRADPEQAPDL